MTDARLTIHPDLPQRSDEWYEARCGLLTASTIGDLITPKTLQPATNDTARGVVARLAAERITGHVEPTYISDDMARGMFDEPIARTAYAAHAGVDVTEVGLMIRDTDTYRLGYSPDGLVGDDGLIEIKSRTQRIHLQTLIADEVPARNLAQIHTGMLVSGRAWCDYVSYCGGMPLYVKRVHRDEAWCDALELVAAGFEGAVTDILIRYPAAVAGRPATERIDHTDVNMEF